MQLARDVTVSEHWFRAYKRGCEQYCSDSGRTKAYSQTSRNAIQVLVRDNNVEQALKVLKKKIGRLP